MDRQDDIDVPDMSQYVTATAGANGDSPTGTQQVIAKMLISNSTAGSIIGKSGANIEQLQKSSGAHVQLSRTGELYPGPSDPPYLIVLIFEKVARDASKAPVPTNAMPKSTRGDVETPTSSLPSPEIVVIPHWPQVSRKTVQDVITDSGANIRLSPTHERVHTAYMESTPPTANSQGVVMQPRSMNSKSALSGYRAAFTFFLPDEDVGAVLGKKGQNLIDIQQEMMDNRSSIITMTSPGIFLRIFDIMKKRREKKREQYEDEQFKHVMNRHNNDVDEEGGAAPPSGGCRSGRCGHKH
eukprot:gene32788-33854_t